MQVISTVFHVFGGGSPTFSTNWGGELKLWHKRLQQMTEPWRWRILGRQKKKLHNFVNEAGISEGNKSLTTSRMVDLRCKVGRVSLRRAMKSMGVKASNLKRESKHKLPLPTSTYLSCLQCCQPMPKAKLHVFEDHWSWQQPDRSPEWVTLSQKMNNLAVPIKKSLQQVFLTMPLTSSCWTKVRSIWDENQRGRITYLGLRVSVGNHQ